MNDNILHKEKQHGGRSGQRSVTLPATKKHNIIVIGDSHARGCSENIKHCSKIPINVIGYVKPNAGTMHTVQKVQKSDIKHLTGNDFG
ncbi:hypothetical protein ANN_18754 [Periplaneta americana]|uniref:Uncharacterized protein n=1 Tax=Periplaneta americana TaxID=6978 RepID=A0ABQ8SR24_PERAM|nr:hypothetical protein ANN_18754 [Periplaneta americana]